MSSKVRLSTLVGAGIGQGHSGGGHRRAFVARDNVTYDSAMLPMPLAAESHEAQQPLPCRVFIDPPAHGVVNMAIDEALLDQAADEERASLRFYQWREPTLSLGYFQAYAERATHAASSHVPIVRRLSGGGALMHDRELTYSLCLPRCHTQSRQSAHLYGVAHLALIEVLASFGVAARMHQQRDALEAVADVAPAQEPFLCFARRTAADIVAAAGRESVKIVGSAQRRRRGAVLQHGALLLDASRFAPELPGLHQVSRCDVDVSAIISGWCDRLAQRLGLVMIPTGGNALEALQNRQPLLEKYASPSWTVRR